MKTKFLSTVVSKILPTGSLVTLFISLTFFGACTQPTQPSKGFSGKPRVTLSVKDITKNVNGFLDEPDIEESVRNLGTADYFALVQSKATDDPIEFGGYQFDGLGEHLKAEEAILAEVSAVYPTMGDLLDAGGVDVFPTEISEQDVQAAASTLNSIINLGGAPDDGQDTLELLNRKGCRIASSIKKTCAAGAGVTCSAAAAGASAGPADIPGVLACIGSSICTGIAGEVGSDECGK